MYKYVRYIIVALFASLLIFPAIQTFKIFELKNLAGSFELTPCPEFSKSSWFDGTFQEQFTKSTEDHIGFRAWFIRLRNELDYDLFHIMHSGAIEGKDQVFYEEYYIASLYGAYNMGEAYMQRKLDKLQFVQDELQKRGIFFMLLIAPGKAAIYPEYFPAKWENAPRTESNYDLLHKLLGDRPINYIDMRSYLTKVKDTATHPLFPRCGTHWSGYTATVVADTMFRYIENKTHLNLTDYQFAKGICTNTDLRFTDNDIGESMNLFFDVPSWDMYYPKLIFKKRDSTTSRPDILSIGDSFNQSFLGFYPFFDSIFGKNSQYWYYNKCISWPDSIASKFIWTENLDYKKEIENRKIILLVTTDHNLKDFGFEFIDRLYEIYCPEIQFESRVKQYIDSVHNNESLRIQTQKRALEINGSFDLTAFIDIKKKIKEESLKADEEWIKNYKDK